MRLNCGNFPLPTTLPKPEEAFGEKNKTNFTAKTRLRDEEPMDKPCTPWNRKAECLILAKK